MFEQLRDSLRGLSARLAPEERRRVAGSMREALVHAKMALQDLREAIAKTESRVATERAELETTRRRGGLATQVGDAETAQIAERFAAQHEERLRVLEMKLMSQQQELALGEREFEDMRAQLRMAMSGVAPSPDARAQDIVDDLDAMLAGHDTPSGAGTTGAADSLDGLDDSGPRRRTRAEREADADERLAALKRKMGR
jgi:hypothetical protein